jgi:hypothetical protein
MSRNLSTLESTDMEDALGLGASSWRRSSIGASLSMYVPIRGGYSLPLPQLLTWSSNWFLRGKEPIMGSLLGTESMLSPKSPARVSTLRDPTILREDTLGNCELDSAHH